MSRRSSKHPPIRLSALSDNGQKSDGEQKSQDAESPEALRRAQQQLDALRKAYPVEYRLRGIGNSPIEREMLDLEHRIQRLTVALVRQNSVLPDPALPQSRSSIQQRKTAVSPGIFEGLKKSIDLSRYMDTAKLTDRQRHAFSLFNEYAVTKTEAAHRMGVHRSTVDEYLAAAKKKITIACQGENWRKQLARKPPR